MWQLLQAVTYIIEKGKKQHHSVSRQAGHIRRRYGVFRQRRELSRDRKKVDGQNPEAHVPVTMVAKIFTTRLKKRHHQVIKPFLTPSDLCEVIMDETQNIPTGQPSGHVPGVTHFRSSKRDITSFHYSTRIEDGYWDGRHEPPRLPTTPNINAILSYENTQVPI